MDAAAPPRRTRGFTLVELIIALVIVGILSMLVAPRFINMGADHRIAKVESMLGAVRSASEGVRGAAAVRGQTAATGAVVFDGMAITTVYGYPAALAADNGLRGIVEAAGMDTTGSNTDGVSLSGGGALPLVIAVNGAATPAACSVSYLAPAADGTPPTIVRTVSGC